MALQVIESGPTAMARVFTGTGQSQVTHIDVHPAFHAMYHSYFIGGLYELFGRESVRFTADDFPEFRHNCLALRVGTPAGPRKIFIHGSDEPTVPTEGLQWCDTLGKVNVDVEKLPEDARDKVISLGPTFPYRVWNGLAAVAVGARTLAAARFRLGYQIDVPASYPAAVAVPLRGVLHLRQFTRIGFERLPLEAYSSGKSRSDYVFFNSAIWPETHEVADYGEANKASNRARLEFIRACQSLDAIQFEGGVFMRARYLVPGYEELVYSRNVTHADYITKTRASCVVFNTPSVKWCHSWKLGEYLALGKAIISLPLMRALPAPLEHGVHIHYVDGSSEQIRDALRQISSDAEYRSFLEHNAREYHERYLSPAAMMRRLLDADTRSVSARPQ